MTREICFDTETTGFEPKEGHRLIEIGCVEILDGRVTDRQCHFYINPERDVPQEATDIHGLTTEFLSDKPIFKDVAQNFLDFIGEDGILVAHNAQFDMRFMNFEMEKAGFSLIQNKVIDSLAIAKSKFPGHKNNLDSLCKRFGIDASKRVKHGALLDAELLADVYIELLGGAQNAMFKNTEESALNGSLGSMELFKQILKQVKNSAPREIRTFEFDGAEFEAHKAFIQKHFKEDSLWDYKNINNQEQN